MRGAPAFSTRRATATSAVAESLCPRRVNKAPSRSHPRWGAKHEQANPYRSEKWQDHYSSGRQPVESVNKSIKGGEFMPVDDAEMRPRRDWTNQLLSVIV